MIRILHNKRDLRGFLLPLLNNKKYTNIVVLTDDNTNTKCLSLFIDAFDNVKLKTHFISITPGEKSKNLSTCNKIWNEMLDVGLDRKTLLVAVGGGVVCDIAGFIANTYKRGIEYVLIPTTLLAQVDAAHGGKNGVNIANVKNAIGTFGKPLEIIINIEFLKTLTKKEFVCGLTEVVKYGIITNSKLIAMFENTNYKDMLYMMIQSSIEIKNKIVKADYYETGIRKSLNFGHTVGHAIEAASDYKVNHGEGVAFGMITALMLSEQMLGLKKEDYYRYVNVIRKHLKLPSPLYVNIPEIIKLVYNDKKNANGQILMVMIDRDLSVKIDVPVSESLLETTLEVVYDLCYQKK